MSGEIVCVECGKSSHTQEDMELVTLIELAGCEISNALCQTCKEHYSLTDSDFSLTYSEAKNILRLRARCIKPS